MRDPDPRDTEPGTSQLRSVFLTAATEMQMPALNLPDPNDRHVLAATVSGGASIIVTNNTKHFPAETLEEFEIEA